MHEMLTTASDDPGSVSLSLSVTRLRCAKTAVTGSRSCLACRLLET